MTAKEIKQLFENAKAAQTQYFDSIIQVVERLEIQIKLLENEVPLEGQENGNDR